MKLNALLKYIMTVCCFAVLCAGCGGGATEEKGAVPGVPSGITASKGDYEDKVLVQWQEVHGAESYVVYKSVDSNNPDQFKVLAINVREPLYSDTPVSPERICYYRIAAANGSAWSNPSDVVEGFALKGTPKPPAQLTVTSDVIGSVNLAWVASVNPNVTSYKVLRATKMYEAYEQVAVITNLASLAFSDTTAVPDQKYYYRIVAVNASGDGAPGDAVAGVALQQVPGTPGGVSATGGTYGEKIVVTWTPADANAASFRIFRAPDVGDGVNHVAGTYTLLAENVTGNAYADRNDGTTNVITCRKPDGTNFFYYYYKVQAVSSGGQSLESSECYGYIDDTKPAVLDPPLSVKASKGSNNLITVTWSAIAGASGYDVYRCATSNGTYDRIAQDVTSTTYNDNLSNPDDLKVTYFYKIRTVSTSTTGDKSYSDFSFAAEGYALPYPPDLPSSITAAMNHSAGTITVTWNNAARAKAYNVYRADDGIDGTYNIVSANQTGLNWVDTAGTTIERGNAYYYKIEAVNAGGKSSLSNALAGKVLATPSITGATKKYNLNVSYTYTITWSAVAGATGYEIIWDGSESKKQTVAGGTTTTATFTINSGALSHDFQIRAVDNDLNIKGNLSAVYKK